MAQRKLVVVSPGYDVKLHPVTNAQFSTIEVLVAMPMTRWEFRIVTCLAGGNAFATCLKMLVMRFADNLRYVLRSRLAFASFFIFNKFIFHFLLNFNKVTYS